MFSALYPDRRRQMCHLPSEFNQSLSGFAHNIADILPLRQQRSQVFV